MNNKEIFLQTNKNIFSEIETHLLFDEKPSIFLNQLIEEDYLKDTCFNILLQLKEIPQNPISHPEGNVWNHTLNVIDEAAKYKFQSNDIKSFMWASLLHDIGKLKTTLIKKDGEIISINHELVGSEMARRLFRACDVIDSLRDSVVSLIKHHNTYLHVLNRTTSGYIHNMIETADIHDVALLSVCNNLGKGELESADKALMFLSANKFLDIMSERTYSSFNKLDIFF